MTNLRFSYIAGPISGKPGGNLPAFRAAEDALSDLGYIGLVPHDFGMNPGMDPSFVPMSGDQVWLDAMWNDLENVAKRRPGSITLLEHWGSSRGARIERGIFEGLGLPLWHYSYNSIVSIRQAPCLWRYNPQSNIPEFVPVWSA